MSTKLFSPAVGIGSGIPKPTAAVKGTAKVIKKPSAIEETVPSVERTPGDGKEVTAISKLNKLHELSFKSNMDMNVQDRCIRTPTHHAINSSSTSRTTEGQCRNPLAINKFQSQPDKLELGSSMKIDLMADNMDKSETVSKNEQKNKDRTTSAPNCDVTSEPESHQANEIERRPECGYGDDDDSCQLNEIQIESQLDNRAESRGVESQVDNKSSAPFICENRLANCLATRNATTGGNGPVAKVSPMQTNGIEMSNAQNANESQASTVNEDEEDESMDVQPMSPLMTTTNLDLLKRHNSYYSSDNESTKAPVSKATVNNGVYNDPLDGYLSEGGASLYARKLNHLAVTQRNKDEDR